MERKLDRYHHRVRNAAELLRFSFLLFAIFWRCAHNCRLLAGDKTYALHLKISFCRRFSRRRKLVKENAASAKEQQQPHQTCIYFMMCNREKCNFNYRIRGDGIKCIIVLMKHKLNGNALLRYTRYDIRTIYVYLWFRDAFRHCHSRDVPSR